MFGFFHRADLFYQIGFRLVGLLFLQGLARATTVAFVAPLFFGTEDAFCEVYFRCVVAFVDRFPM